MICRQPIHSFKVFILSFKLRIFIWFFGGFEYQGFKLGCVAGFTEVEVAGITCVVPSFFLEAFCQAAVTDPLEETSLIWSSILNLKRMLNILTLSTWPFDFIHFRFNSVQFLVTVILIFFWPCESFKNMSWWTANLFKLFGIFLYIGFYLHFSYNFDCRFFLRTFFFFDNIGFLRDF